MGGGAFLDSDLAKSPGGLVCSRFGKCRGACVLENGHSAKTAKKTISSIFTDRFMAGECARTL